MVLTFVFQLENGTDCMQFRDFKRSWNQNFYFNYLSFVQVPFPFIFNVLKKAIYIKLCYFEV